MRPGPRWMGLAVLLGVGACVFQPDLSRFPACDAQGGCEAGWTCLAAEGVCLPDCGGRGPCTGEEPQGMDTDGGTDGGIDAGTDGGTDAGSDGGEPDAGPQQLVLVPDGPGTGTETVSYFHRFQVSGGTPPYTFSTTGELPPGLSLDTSRGELSGKPTAAGDYSFTVEVVDQGAEPQRSSQNFSMQIRPVLHLAGPDVLVYFESGKEYVEYLSAIGGKPPYSFEIVNGGLPSGIVLRSNGKLDGAAYAGSGTPPFDVRVTDSDSPPQSAVRRLQLTSITCSSSEVCIKSSALPDARVGSPYTHLLQSTPASVTWKRASGTLPPGITLTGETGRLSGTPTQAGMYEFNITATAGGLLPPAPSTITLKLTVY
ncbi:Ig domain-containing protein [Archangium lansingense]|uniref:Ig domain-containing protein n=1 Tax=Archangium lansingense TaxID=2995310 RepID=A0ABT3ZWN7_9BACT|nr:Ig domain-containing protein [Archangium lansinium]MCY1073521.1 Ig domain-containing protein [Archangium lansinium]